MNDEVVVSGSADDNQYVRIEGVTWGFQLVPPGGLVRIRMHAASSGSGGAVLMATHAVVSVEYL